MGTVLLENPAGRQLFSSVAELQQGIRAIYGTSKNLSLDGKKSQPVKISKGIDELHGKTLHML